MKNLITSFIVSALLLLSASLKGEVKFLLDESGLHVTITTDRLIIKSVDLSDEGNLISVYGNPVTMEKFAEGKPRTPERVQKTLKIWDERWKNNDPTGGFCIFLKENMAFIGIAVLGKGDLPGEAELAYLLLPEYQSQRFGSEAVTSIICEFVPLIQAYPVFGGSPLQKIYATARTDNERSWKILERLGFNHMGIQRKFDVDRYLYIKIPFNL